MIRGRGSFISAARTRNPSTRRSEPTWSGPLRGPLFGLAPDGVFRAPSITLGAVGSYPAFSPLPLDAREAVCFLWHCPSILTLVRTSRAYAGVHPADAELQPDCTASRPLVFGLSSPLTVVRGATLRPSRTDRKLRPGRTDDNTQGGPFRWVAVGVTRPRKEATALRACPPGLEPNRNAGLCGSLASPGCDQECDSQSSKGTV